MHDAQGARRRPLPDRETFASADADLAAAVGRGDRTALAEIYRREGGRIRAVARTVCGAERADDVTQDVLVALWQRPDRFDPARGTLRSFLLLQARSRATDVLRSDSSRAARQLAVSTNDAARTRESVGQVEDDVLGRIGGETIHAALSTIPQTEREVIALAFFGGRTYRQVAAILGRPEGTVKSQIRTGLVRLRAVLDDQSPTDEPAHSHLLGRGADSELALAR